MFFKIHIFIRSSKTLPFLLIQSFPCHLKAFRMARNEKIQWICIIPLPFHSFLIHSMQICCSRMALEWWNEVKWSAIFEPRQNPWFQKLSHSTIIRSFHIVILIIIRSFHAFVIIAVIPISFHRKILMSKLTFLHSTDLEDLEDQVLSLYRDSTWFFHS